MSLRNLLTGIGVGALGMYFLDPQRGRRRQSLLRDQIDSMIHCVQEFVDVTGRDLNNRVRGLAMETAAVFQNDDAPDQVIQARVRAKLGRYVSHPRAIEVDVHDGHVSLRGPILSYEVAPFLAAVRSVRGVHGVENQLEQHDQPGNISSLQGGTRRTGEHYDLFQETWSPGTRLVSAMIGTGLMLNCFARRSPGSSLLGAVGLGLFVRAATNQESREWLNPRPNQRQALPQGSSDRSRQAQGTESQQREGAGGERQHQQGMAQPGQGEF